MRRKKLNQQAQNALLKINRGTAGICCHPASDHKCGQFSANDFIAVHYTESQSGKRRCDQILPDENRITFRITRQMSVPHFPREM